jgi:alpha-N-acetylglucosaminidase
MRLKWLVLGLLVVACSSDPSTGDAPLTGDASSINDAPPVVGKAVDPIVANAAITRMLGGDIARASQIELRPMALPAGAADAYAIGGAPGHVVLSGTSTVALLSAFHWWLKYVAGGHLSTNGDRLGLPSTLPAPTSEIAKTTSLTDRYAYNFTTFGYTSPYWKWPEWERELDYLAASGVNRALMLVGQEIVWHDTLTQFDLTSDEVRRWILQPAHQPWQWYGSIRGYDQPNEPCDTDDEGAPHEVGAVCEAGRSLTPSPMSMTLMKDRAALGRKIADRMRELGIEPVFPAFIGHVPSSFKDHWSDEEAKVFDQGDYGGHPRPEWMDSTSPLYAEIAATFYAAQRARFGVTRYFSNDLLHEGGNTGDVAPGAAARAVQDAMLAFEPKSVWLLQAWQDNPRKEVVQALDSDHILVLDLDADDGPRWSQTDAFWGVPWAWGTIQNFGGRLGTFGNLYEPGTTLPGLLARPVRERGHLTGTAMVLEGTHNNPVVLDLFGEMVWRQQAVDLPSWIADYAKRRYGVNDPHALAAWKTLLDTAYAFRATGHEAGEGCRESPFTAQPRLTFESSSTWGPKDDRYDVVKLASALDELLAVDPAIHTLSTYRYDLVDVARQVLADRARALLDEIGTAYRSGNKQSFGVLSQRFLHYMHLSEELLSTHADWMLGPWLEAAKSWGTNADDRLALEYDARSIVSIWTPDAWRNLHDYANRDWAGMIGGLYEPRWTEYFKQLTDSFQSGAGSGDPTSPWFDDGSWDARWLELDKGFARETKAYPTQPSGDTFTVAKRIATELAAE